MIRNEVAGDALNWGSLKPARADQLSFMGGFLVSSHVKEKDEKCKRQSLWPLLSRLHGGQRQCSLGSLKKYNKEQQLLSVSS